MNPTLYDILGVRPDAGRDEVKAAWREAADRFEPGSGGSTAQFRLFNEAAEVLLDPERRKAYDEQLAATAPAVEVPSSIDLPPAAEGSPKSRPTWLPRRDRSARATATAQAPATQRRGVPVAVLAVLGLLTAVTMGLAIYVGSEYQAASAYEDALDQAPSSAERAAAAVLSYDHKSLDADRDAAAKFLTAGYRKDYVKTFELVQQNAPKMKAKVEAEVLASSAMLETGEDSPDRVPVLLFVNQTTLSTANAGEPSVALNRVRFDMVNEDGTWKVDGITSY
jgi:Mce-associated membrane protein